MGFFFTAPKRQPRAKKPANATRRLGGATPKSRQSAATFNRLGCKVCPLKNAGAKCEPDLAKKTDIFFLGASPSKKDVKNNTPFSGKDGKLLEEVIPDTKRVSFGHIVMHRPPDDRPVEFPEIESCRGYVTAAIEKAKPKVIVGLGPAVLHWFTGTVDMIGLRGRLMAVKIGSHKCWFIPTYDPEYVVDKAYDTTRPLNGKFGMSFRLDIEKAFNFLATYKTPTILEPNEVKKDIECFDGSKTNGRTLEALFKHFKYANKAKLWSIDLETYPLRPYDADAVLLTASISYWRKGRLMTFAFSIDHPKSGWSKAERKKVVEALRELVVNKKSTKIAHNVPFEIEWLFFLYGPEIAQHKRWEDTMVMAHLLDERKGPGKEEDRRPTYQSLNFLTKQYLGLPIKSLFKLDKKDMRKSNIEECLMYNGVDSKYTMLLHDIQYKLLEDEELTELFEFIKPRQTSVALMQYLGLPVDQNTVKSFQDKLASEIKELEEKIQKLKVIKQYNKDKGSKFNPHSVPEVLVVFKDYLKRKEIKVDVVTNDMVYDKPSEQKRKFKEDETKERYAVDKNVLAKIDHPLSDLILKIRNKQKLKSTYVDEFVVGSGTLIYPDGKLHANFNTTFTVTGRLSCEDPNLQNFPKREDKWIRGQIKAPKGYVMISIDYGQLEWCLACICTKDKVMVDATWNGIDIHMDWAERIAKRWPEIVGGKKGLKDSSKMKKLRGLAKNKMVFPAIFGAREESIGGYLSMPPDVTKDIFADFWKIFHGLGTWHKKTMRHYYDKGYVSNLFGRRRRYPMTKNEAVNHPIQATAAEIVCNAMDRLSMLALKTGKWYLHPILNIHDDLTLLVPDDETIIDEAIETAVREMLALPFDFINVPMSVEVSIGPDWENQEEIGKFFTTDFE